jgi:DNA polymerase IV (DinB-like DNA polymerase)
MLQRFHEINLEFYDIRKVGNHMDRWVMHIDLDAFYASVEQYRNYPELQGLPVCVGHDPKRGMGRGVVRVASYEARSFGIHAGMPVSKAYRLCPEAVFIDGDFSSYIEASHEFMDILSDFADGGRVRRASIDEAYIDVTFRAQDYPNVRSLAVDIQDSVMQLAKLPCSLGVAPNMSVAKIATDINKPLGITIVEQGRDDILSFLAPLDVDAINGVGKKTADRLSKYGIKKLGQIQKMTITELWPIMGKGSSWLHKRASGIDDRPIVDNGPRVRKSISHDRTFMEDVDPEAIEYLHETIHRMCSSIAKKLIKKSLHFRTVTMKIRYSNYSTIQRSKSIPVETDDEELLHRIAIELFDQKRDLNQQVRLLGVKVSGLSEKQSQLCLTEFI